MIPGSKQEAIGSQIHILFHYKKMANKLVHLCNKHLLSI